MAITDLPEVLRAPALPEVLPPPEIPFVDEPIPEHAVVAEPPPAHEVSDSIWHLLDVADILQTDTLPYLKQGLKEDVLPLLKRKAGQALGFVGCAAAAGIGSLMYLPAHTNVGPHEARVTLNADPDITVDLGPIGKGHIPTKGPGAEVVLKKIPENPNGNGELLGADLSQLMDRYIQLFTDTSQNQAQITEALKRHFEASALIGGAAMLEAFYLLRFTLRKIAGQERWDHFIDQLPQGQRDASRMLAALIVLLPAAGIGSRPRDPQQLPGLPVTNSVIASKLPQGITLEGEVLNLLADRVGPAAVDEWNKSNAFFDKATVEMGQKLDQAPLFPEEENTATFMVLADLHCNIGQLKVWGEVRQKLGINLVVLPGDLTMSGTTYEEPCVKTVRFRMGDNTVVAYYGGNHDSSVTVTQAQKYGFINADGTVFTYDALKLLGGNDPEHTDLFKTTDPNPATATALGERLVAAACAAGGNVTMVNHRQEADLPAMQVGCATGGIAGHTHAEDRRNIYCRIGDQLTQAPLFVAGTAGGAAPNKPTIIGPNSADALATVFQFDTVTGKILRYRTLTTHKNASASIGPLTSFSLQTVQETK
ncbi:MAG TPA: metallophosphoesterase family protein [Patescibacteria group bacterium]|nr:metallophosphoesterase family protein [Patescibacteria group bacterium]